MKKLIAFALVLTMMLSMLVVTTSAAAWDGTTASASLKGEGTEASPYLIETADDFMLFTENMRRSTGITQDTAYGKGLYFRQTANIDLTGIVEYDGLVMTKAVQYGFASVTSFRLLLLPYLSPWLYYPVRLHKLQFWCSYLC